MFDPEGKGHHGAEGIGAFWDAAISMVDSFHFTINDSHANGNVCANVGTITTRIGTTRVDTDLVMIYTVTEDDLVASMRAYWNPDRAIATMRSES
jgi:threonine dehydratase